MRRAARVLLYLGTAGAVLGLGKLHAARHGYDYTDSFRFAWSFAYIGLLCMAAYGLGLPDLVRTARSSAATAIGASAAAAGGISLLQLVVGSALLPRFVVFGAAVLLVPWYVLCAALASGARDRAEERDRVFLVAGPEEAATLADDLGRGPERPAQLVGVLGLDAARSAGRRRPLVEQAIERSASVVVLTRLAQADESIVAQAAALHEAGIRVRTLSLFYEEWLGKVPLPELERMSLMFDIGELHRARYGRLKRVADLAVGAAGIVALAAAVPFVLLGNALGNRGPLIYRQLRVGRWGQPFSILKFRTMRPEEGGRLANEWTTERDPRITPFGGFLRRTHLDELPQVVNILRGDLSLVGPRPEQPHYVADLVEKLPFYNLRHLVRPGLTGWAQVKYGYAGNETDAMEKLQYEFFYLRHQSLLLDARILGRTIRSVMALGGR